MTPDTAITAREVSKHYPIFSSASERLKHLVARTFSGKGQGYTPAKYFTALDRLTFDVKKGERLGVVGRNGAGKSTLLKLVAGSFEPDEGSFDISGELQSLLPDSVAFDLMLSLEQNAYQHLGRYDLSLEEIESRVDEIREFVELGPYFEQPVKSLSTGMLVRGQFAVATARSADIVVIDEVIGAGDIYWSEKIARRMDDLCATGSTLVLVSHSLSQINRYCERAIWIERGGLVMDGPAFQVTKIYESFLERLSWKMHDIEDTSVTINDVAADLRSQMRDEFGEGHSDCTDDLQDQSAQTARLFSERLPKSGQLVNRMPGNGDVLITGIWVNGRSDTDVIIGSDEETKFSVSLESITSGEKLLRLLINFWDERGTRVAAVENSGVVINHEKGSKEILEVTLGPSRISSGTCWVSFSLFNLMREDSTLDEKSTRSDGVSKSFRLQFGKSNQTSRPRPRYQVPGQISPVQQRAGARQSSI